jgi:hypothetical protein
VIIDRDQSTNKTGSTSAGDMQEWKELQGVGVQCALHACRLKELHKKYNQIITVLQCQQIT